MNASASKDKVTVYGFHYSTYVSAARQVLHAKGVAYDFHDTEAEMYTAQQCARHPFGRVPVLRHGDFQLYETSAIVRYVDDAFEGPKLTPSDVRQRAVMNQWISNLDSYFYPYMTFYVVHERLIFPELGIESDSRAVAHALPRCKRALEILEAQLVGRNYVVCERPTLADYFFLPTLTAFGVVAEGKEMLQSFPLIRAWCARMAELPNVKEFRAMLPPRTPLEHARRWPIDHRPGAGMSFGIGFVES